MAASRRSDEGLLADTGLSLMQSKFLRIALLRFRWYHESREEVKMNGLIKFIAAIALIGIHASGALANDLINAKPGGVAVKGYDVVAYFTQDRAIEGSEDFVHEWRGVLWRFSSPEHLAAFRDTPENYAPRYGGFCSGGMALGNRAPIDPEAFAVIDGKLYLNYSKAVLHNFKVNPEEKIKQADANWAKMNDE
jgi:YHS domain-containing protein